MLYDKNLPDRLRVAHIDTTRTIDVAECATCFLVTDTGDAGYAITLPTAANAGPGWWCKFLVDEDALASNAGDDVIITPGEGGAADAIAINYADDDDIAGGAAQKNIGFDHTADRGDWIKVWTDGSFWYGWGFTSVNGGIGEDGNTDGTI